MSPRDDLKKKLVKFYKQHDAARLNHGIDAVVDYGLAEGLEALNLGLEERYGVGLDGAHGGNAANGWSAAERQIVRSRIEMFYLKHDPAKLDVKSDIDAVIEWAMYHGVDALSEKLGRKYEEGIEEVVEGDVLVQLESFYSKHDKSKTQEDIRTVLTWGIVNGFCELSQKMIQKYGEGLGSTDRTKLKKEIHDKLTKFYKNHDKSKLRDPEQLEFIVGFALKQGLHNLNTRLQNKYGANMNTIVRAPPKPSSPRPPSKRASVAHSVRKSIKSLTKRASKPINMTPEQAAEAAVQDDIEYQNYLRKLVEVFYARHDPNRLIEEGVSPIINFAIAQGESALNEKLRGKYKEDLQSIDDQFQIVREKLLVFYARYDPSKLDKEREQDMDTIVGWALVNGEERLNATLMKKYDEDLDGNGLKVRLRIFYEANEKKPKSEKELQSIVDWVFDNSVEELNQKLKKKYGKSLVDTTFMDLPPPPPPTSAPPPKPSSSNKNKKKAPLPPDAPPMSELPNEGDTNTTQSNLEDHLSKFYALKNPSKNNSRQIKKDVKEILSNGVDHFNARLLKEYGESLNSVRNRANGATLGRGHKGPRRGPRPPSQGMPAPV